MRYISLKGTTTAVIESAEHVSDLPVSLQGPVNFFVSKNLLEKIPFFSGRPIHLLLKYASKLRPISFSHHETLYLHGDPSEEVFFIVDGKISLMTIDGISFASYRGGTILGIDEAVAKLARKCTAKTLLPTLTFTMSSQLFREMLQDFPEVEQEIRRLSADLYENEERSRRLKRKQAESTKGGWIIGNMRKQIELNQSVVRKYFLEAHIYVRQTQLRAVLHSNANAPRLVNRIVLRMKKKAEKVRRMRQPEYEQQIKQIVAMLKTKCQEHNSMDMMKGWPKAHSLAESLKTKVTDVLMVLESVRQKQAALDDRTSKFLARQAN